MKKEYKVLYISEIRHDILKALRKHAYETSPQIRIFSNRVVNLEEACSVVRYHLNKYLK